MKASSCVSAFLVAAALNFSTVSQSRAAAPRETPALETALKERDGRSLVLQPIQIRPGQSLVVTHTRFGDGSVRGSARAVQLVVYSTTKNESTGEYPVLFTDTRTIDRSAPQVQVFGSYIHPINGQQQGIIAILIGLLQPENEPDSPRTAQLPRSDAITAEVRDPGTGIPLLLPAVQKVREAAAR